MSHSNSNHANIERINAFIAKHHLLSLATSQNNIPQVANLFFAYDSTNVRFIVASDDSTEHIQNVLQNTNVAGSIALETEEVGKIEGIQFTAQMSEAKESDRQLYFKRFPYARVMNPKLWQIVLQSIKLTDNTLGFGKKLKWSKED